MPASEEQFSDQIINNVKQASNTISAALHSKPEKLWKKSIILFIFPKSEDSCTQRRGAPRSKVECRYCSIIGFYLSNPACKPPESFIICVILAPVTTHSTPPSFRLVYVVGLICWHWRGGVACFQSVTLTTPGQKHSIRPIGGVSWVTLLPDMLFGLGLGLETLHAP